MPIVMAIVNRAIAMPICINPDHIDSLAQRIPPGFNSTLRMLRRSWTQSSRLIRSLRIPGFFFRWRSALTGWSFRTFMNRFSYQRRRRSLDFWETTEPGHVVLDPDRPMSIGIFANEFYLTEYKYQQQKAMENAKR
jgi:pyruvate ferredoxin oxidoreductase alpha subunit